MGPGLRLKQLAYSFTTTLAEELDYRTEATNIGQMAEPIAATGMVMPKVYGEFASQRLLVMDELVGAPRGRRPGRTRRRSPRGRPGWASSTSVRWVAWTPRTAPRWRPSSPPSTWGTPGFLTDALLGLMYRPEELDIRALQRSVSALLSRYGGGSGTARGRTVQPADAAVQRLQAGRAGDDRRGAAQSRRAVGHVARPRPRLSAGGDRPT